MSETDEHNRTVRSWLRMEQPKMSEEVARVIATVRTHAVSNYVEGSPGTVTLPVHVYEFLFESLKRTREFLRARGE